MRRSPTRPSMTAMTPPRARPTSPAAVLRPFALSPPPRRNGSKPKKRSSARTKADLSASGRAARFRRYPPQPLRHFQPVAPALRGHHLKTRVAALRVDGHRPRGAVELQTFQAFEGSPAPSLRPPPPPLPRSPRRHCRGYRRNRLRARPRRRRASSAPPDRARRRRGRRRRRARPSPLATLRFRAFRSHAIH